MQREVLSSIASLHPANPRMLGPHQAPPLRRLPSPSRETMGALLETLPIVAWNCLVVSRRSREGLRVSCCYVASGGATRGAGPRKVVSLEVHVTIWFLLLVVSVFQVCFFEYILCSNALRVTASFHLHQ